MKLKFITLSLLMLGSTALISACESSDNQIPANQVPGQEETQPVQPDSSITEPESPALLDGTGSLEEPSETESP